MTNLCATHGINVPDVGCPKCLKAENERLLALINGLQQERLTWAMVCECSCNACEKLSSAIHLAGQHSQAEPTSEPVLSPMAPEDHLHARIESQRQEIERLKPPGRVNPNTAGPCPLCGRTDNHSHTAGPFGMS